MPPLLPFTAIALGILLRLSWLDALPYGIDNEEAEILYWAGRAVADGKLWWYAPVATQWENLPGLIFSLGGLVSGCLRFVPAVFGIVEIFACAWLGRVLLGTREAGWRAGALLALCPWHLYYSRTLATSVGTGALFCWVIAAPRAGFLVQVLRSSLGLLYYTIFRLAFVRGLLHRQAILPAVVAGVVVLSVLFFSDSSWRLFFTRGAYNMTASTESILHNLLGTGAAFFVGVPDAYTQARVGFLADSVHAGFVHCLSGLPPLGLGLVTALVAAFFCKPTAKLRPEILFLVVSATILGVFGPQLSRFLCLLPLIAVVGAHGVGKRSAVFAGILLLNLLTLFPVAYRLADRSAMEPYFHPRWRELDRLLRENPSASVPVYAYAEAGYSAARHYHDRGRAPYELLPPFEAPVLQALLPGEAILVFSAEPRTALSVAGDFRPISRFEQAYAWAERHPELQVKRVLWSQGRRVGTLFRIGRAHDAPKRG